VHARSATADAHRENHTEDAPEDVHHFLTMAERLSKSREPSQLESCARTAVVARDHYECPAAT
jgi:hypothetical protein